MTVVTSPAYEDFITRVESVLDALTGHLSGHYTEAAEGDMFVGEQVGALDYLLIGMTEEGYRPPDDVLSVIRSLIADFHEEDPDRQRFQGFYDKIVTF